MDCVRDRFDHRHTCRDGRDGADDIFVLLEVLFFWHLMLITTSKGQRFPTRGRRSCVACGQGAS